MRYLRSVFEDFPGPVRSVSRYPWLMVGVICGDWRQYREVGAPDTLNNSLPRGFGRSVDGKEQNGS